MVGVGVGLLRLRRPVKTKEKEVSVMAWAMSWIGAEEDAQAEKVGPVGVGSEERRAAREAWQFWFGDAGSVGDGGEGDGGDGDGGDSDGGGGDGGDGDGGGGGSCRGLTGCESGAARSGAGARVAMAGIRAGPGTASTAGTAVVVSKATKVKACMLEQSLKSKDNKEKRMRW